MEKGDFVEIFHPSTPKYHGKRMRIKRVLLNWITLEDGSQWRPENLIILEVKSLSHAQRCELERIGVE